MSALAAASRAPLVEKAEYGPQAATPSLDIGTHAGQVAADLVGLERCLLGDVIYVPEDASEPPQHDGAKSGKRHDRDRRYEKEDVHLEEFVHMQSMVARRGACPWYAVSMKPHKDLPMLVFLFGISVLAYLVFAPFLVIISVAAVLAVLLHPSYEKLSRSLGGWKSGAALITVALTLALVVGPLFYLGAQVLGQAQAAYAGIQGGGAGAMLAVQAAIDNAVRSVSPGFTLDLHALVGNALAAISNNLGSLAYKTVAVVFETFLMLLALFYFLRDGRSWLASAVHMSPFGKDATDDLARRLHVTILSVVRGTLFIVIVRAACMWAAFSLFGIPNAVLWGVAGGVIGAIPGLGTAFAFVCAVAYLYVQGQVLLAVGLALVGVFAVIFVDNILTSYFFSAGLDVPPLFMLFAILGGIAIFGPLGFLLGPLVLSAFVSAVRA